MTLPLIASLGHLEMINTISLSNSIFQHKLYGLKLGICISQQVSEIVKRHLSVRPFHLNVIEAACHGRFKETGHSLVLADMLKHPVIQCSFLERFLNLEYNHLAVTAETDRVDVALKGEEVFVIIENKVNAAEEQRSQVYRYVHEIGIDKYGYNLSQIYVIYLNPTNHHSPSNYSLCDENGENNVFTELGEEHHAVLSYKDDITEWLQCLSVSNEPHIDSALDQYIDFLENKFHTTPLDRVMNNEIKELLLKELHVENNSMEEQIQALENQYEKTEELLRSIENLKDEIRKKLSLQKVREWQKEIEKQLGLKLSDDEHSFGIQLKNGVWIGVWDGHDSPDHLPYWGCQKGEYGKADMPELYEQTIQLLEKVGIKHFKTENKGWIAWCTTQHGVERFISLYRGAQEMDLL